MDLPNSQQLNNVPDDEAMDYCRLRHGLLKDCLVKVLEYVSDTDLIQVSKMGIYYKDVIAEDVISKKFIEAAFLDESKVFTIHDKSTGIRRRYNHEIFDIFGEWIRKCKIYMADLTYFLETIVKCGAPATLLEVEIEIISSYLNDQGRDYKTYVAYLTQAYKTDLDLLNDDQTYQTDLDLLNQSMPFFSNLRKLTYVRREGVRRDQFLEKLLAIASKLETLHLEDVNFDGGCLENMKNLKSFTYIGHQNVTTFGDVLSKNCSGLKTFECIQKTNVDDLINRYNFLSTFSDLNNVSLTVFTDCGCDLYYPLLMLANKNIVKLKLFINEPTTFSDNEREQILRSSITNFHRLETLEINIRSLHKFDLQKLQFIMHFLSYSTNIKHFTIKTDGYSISGVSKILQLLPNIQTLSISGARLFHVPVEIFKIVGVLRKRLIGANGDQNLCKVVVDGEQWNELSVYKDIKDIMRIEKIIRR